jgi:hypothetical protein
MVLLSNQQPEMSPGREVLLTMQVRSFALKFASVVASYGIQLLQNNGEPSLSRSVRLLRFQIISS